MVLKLVKSSFAVLGIVILLQGCGAGSNTGVINELTFDSVVVTKSEHLLDNEKYPACDLKLSFRFPAEYTDTVVLARLQGHFTESVFGEKYKAMTPRDAAQTYVVAYLDEYKELEVPYAEDVRLIKERPVGSWYSYVEHVSNEVTFNASCIISQKVTTYTYTGGAHGAHEYKNYVFGLTNGERIMERDIFVTDYTDSLTTLLVDAIVKKMGVANRSDLKAEGFIGVDNILPNGNFLVDLLGITYTFNEYEIAAYFVGETDVRFTYSELGGLLLRDSPISHLFTDKLTTDTE